MTGFCGSKDPLDDDADCLDEWTNKRCDEYSANPSRGYYESVAAIQDMAAAIKLRNERIAQLESEVASWIALKVDLSLPEP